MKFEKGLNTATLLSNEVKWRQVALLERDILLKNLKSVLESLRGQVAGKFKDEIEESVSMVDILAVQLSKRENELLQQKTEVTRIATSLKLASEDARTIVDEERANARTEIENARAAVQRVQQVLKDKENCSQRIGKQLELHQRFEENDAPSYELEGLESLGSMLRLVVQNNVSLSNASVQWFRIQPQGSKTEIISGATKLVYAPEPHDVGRYLQAEVNLGGEISVAKTAGPVDPAAGLVDYVETLVRNPETEYNVVVLQVNGIGQPTDSIHVLCIGKLRMRLAKERRSSPRNSTRRQCSYAVLEGVETLLRKRCSGSPGKTSASSWASRRPGSATRQSCSPGDSLSTAILSLLVRGTKLHGNMIKRQLN
ncbi:hypothetical protein ACQ4PT_038488 [Festuca glaucescens]